MAASIALATHANGKAVKKRTLKDKATCSTVFTTTLAASVTGPKRMSVTGLTTNSSIEITRLTYYARETERDVSETEPPSKEPKGSDRKLKTNANSALRRKGGRGKNKNASTSGSRRPFATQLDNELKSRTEKLNGDVKERRLRERLLKRKIDVNVTQSAREKSSADGMRR